MAKKNKPMSNKEFVKNRGSHCPVCRSHDLYIDGTEIYETGIVQSITCGGCKVSYIEHYRLAGYKIEDLNTENGES